MSLATLENGWRQRRPQGYPQTALSSIIGEERPPQPRPTQLQGIMVLPIYHSGEPSEEARALLISHQPEDSGKREAVFPKGSSPELFQLSWSALTSLTQPMLGLVCGAVMPGELPQTAAVRELGEEAGLKVDDNQLHLLSFAADLWQVHQFRPESTGTNQYMIFELSIYWMALHDDQARLLDESSVARWMPVSLLFKLLNQEPHRFRPATLLARLIQQQLHEQQAQYEMGSV